MGFGTVLFSNKPPKRRDIGWEFELAVLQVLIITHTIVVVQLPFSQLVVHICLKLCMLRIL